jgi:hypothetical protein
MAPASDIPAAMSDFELISSALHPGSDVADSPGIRGVMTQRRSLAVFESGMVSTFTMVFRRLCMEAGTIRQNRRKSFGWENINSPSETSHRSSQNCPVLLVIMTREGDNDR